MVFTVPSAPDRLAMNLGQLLLRWPGLLPRRCETIVAIPGDEVDVVVKYLLPSGSPIGLSHVQTERLQSLSELGGHAMNRSHDGSRIVLCQRPYVRRMSSRYHQRNRYSPSPTPSTGSTAAGGPRGFVAIDSWGWSPIR